MPSLLSHFSASECFMTIFVNKLHIPLRLAAGGSQRSAFFKKSEGVGGRDEGKVANSRGEDMETRDDRRKVKCRKAKLFLRSCCSSF